MYLSNVNQASVFIHKSSETIDFTAISAILCLKKPAGSVTEP
jgi:hypothetical protein